MKIKYQEDNFYRKTDFEKLHEMQNREKRDKSTLFELAEAC